MIDFVRGKVVARDAGHVVVDIGNVGLGVDVPQSVALRAGSGGETVTLFTQLVVREDAMNLVGFSTELQRRMFQALTSVTGIGTKVALKALGEVEPEELAAAIVRGDVRRLTALPGIGKKTAEVLIATLRDTMGKMSISAPALQVAGISPGAPAPAGAERDAILALQALGMNEALALAAVQGALGRLGAQADTAALVSEALRRM